MEKKQRLKQINWYPGHMFKSFKIIDKELRQMDLVFLLLDSRIPYSSMNPQILKVLKNKPTLILLNKSSLADRSNLAKWIKHYEDEGFQALAIDSITGYNINEINNKAMELLEAKLAREKARGMKERNLKAMVLGIPNVGKSTLINRLAKRRSTKTGDTPGLTKTKQWIRLANGFDLLDMPGVLWPKFEDETVGFNLAVTGAIRDHILPLDEVTLYLITYMQENYLTNLQNRYGEEITKDLDFVSVLDHIGKRRGALIRGGEIDYDRVYGIILHDLRNKMLGEVSFDKI